MPYRFGSHMSVAGGLGNAIDRALSVGADAVQIFVKNNMQWFAKPLSDAEAASWNAHPRRKELRTAIGHTGYLLNLAATNPDFHARSLRSLHEELVRAGQIHLPCLVLHPGAHMGAGGPAGLRRVAESLDRVFDELPDHPVRIALETTAGQGTCLGHTFEHLRDLIGAVREPGRLCVCLDTAHVFAAGYDLSTAEGTLATLEEFDRIVGLRHLVALHLNDSKAARGSRVDRHEAIGRGHIGLAAFGVLLHHPKLRRLPMVLETPKGPELNEDRVNLATLRGLLAKPDGCA